MTTFAIHMTSLETQTQETTISQESSFEHVFHKYYDGLHRYCSTMIFDQLEAEDLVQATFMDLWNERKSLVIHTSIQAYLYKSIYFKSMNKLKHEKVVRKYLDTIPKSEQAQESDSLVYSEIRDKVDSSIENLPEQCRKIFKLSRLDGLKYAEIANQLNLSPKTIENQMGRALKSMRIALSEYIKILFLLINILS